MTASTGRRQPQAARLAVAAVFFANGALFANVIPRYPEIRNDLGLEQRGARVGARGLPPRCARGGCVRGGPHPAVRLGEGRDPRDRRPGAARSCSSASPRAGCARGDPVRGGRDRRGHRRRAERARVASAARLRTLDRQLVPRDLEHRRGVRWPDGRGDDRARRVARGRARRGVARRSRPSRS